MSLPDPQAPLKDQGDKRITSSDHESGLTADEFMSAADRLLESGHHPLAIGQADAAKPDKPAGKAPWHTGVTGYRGVDADRATIASWPMNVAARIRDGASGILNLGMRMPQGGLGIDVDGYDGKRGPNTITEHENRLGGLPLTYRITARPYQEGSGIRLYRVPDDWRGKTILKSDDGTNGHVELIQRHHRLAAVPPSHHHAGSRYRVYDERTGEVVPGGVVPPLVDWPKFPDGWLDGVRVDSTKAATGEATSEVVERFAAEHVADEQPWHLAEYVVPQVRDATSNTRNAAFGALHEAARMARVGWYSWTTAEAEIEAAARDSYTRRGTTFDEIDFARSVRSAVAAANSENLADLEQRAERRLAQRDSRSRAEHAMAPGGRWHPEAVMKLLHADPASDGEDEPSWAPVNIASARRGVGATPPTILARADGACLFYQGKTHSVHGESESGKSWLVQCATAELLTTGEPVLYIDFEDDGGAVAEQLILLGVPPEVVDDSALFVYVHPEAPPTTEREREAFNLLLAATYSLAVIDGVTDSMGVFGLSGKDADDVAKWHRLLPKAVARNTGAAVVCVDHVAKDPQTRGRFALGSQHKMAGLSGAAYVVEMEQPFAVGQAGRASVRVGKDRPGRVRGLGGRWRKGDRTQHVADLHLDSTDLETTVWSLAVPENAGKPTETDTGKPVSGGKVFRPTWFMEQVSLYWEETDDPTDRTNSKTVKAMCDEREAKGKPLHREHWRTAIRVLEDEGYAKSVKGARASDVFTSLKPYRQRTDPLCDEYSEAALVSVENWKRKLKPSVDGSESEAET